MKKINKDDLYQNLSGFLAGKGLELKDGAYTARIRKGCSLLADCVNFAQGGLGQAKEKMDEKLDHMRQVIHEKTAPVTPPNPGQPKAKAAWPKTKVKARNRRAANPAKPTDSEGKTA
jgi:hypothetical protein